MQKIIDLMNCADESATWRGHALGEWIQEPERHRAGNECRHCGAQVRVTTHPLPNDADVMGDAVSVGCPDVIGALHDPATGKQEGPRFYGKGAQGDVAVLKQANKWFFDAGGRDVYPSGLQTRIKYKGAL